MRGNSCSRKSNQNRISKAAAPAPPRSHDRGLGLEAPGWRAHRGTLMRYISIDIRFDTPKRPPPPAASSASRARDLCGRRPSAAAADPLALPLQGAPASRCLFPHTVRAPRAAAAAVSSPPPPTNSVDRAIAAAHRRPPLPPLPSPQGPRHGRRVHGKPRGQAVGALPNGVARRGGGRRQGPARPRHHRGGRRLHRLQGEPVRPGHDRWRLVPRGGLPHHRRLPGAHGRHRRAHRGAPPPPAEFFPPFTFFVFFAPCA